MVSRGADPPPFELVKALMADRFHMSPEEVENHPADTLLQYFAILNFFDDRVSKLKR